MNQTEWTPVSTHALDLGEGLRPTRDGARWVDLENGELYAWTPGNGAAVLTHRLPQPLGFAEEDAAGRLIAAAGTGVVELLVDGTAVPLADTGLNPARYRVNDGAFAPDGSLWFGTMVHDGSEPGGAVWRWDPASGAVVQLRGGIPIPNGPLFLPDGRRVLISDTEAGTILKTTTADPGVTEVFAQVPDGNPDGMFADARGRIWSAVWGAARLDVYAGDGQRLGSVPLPVRQPTSVLVLDGQVLVTSAATGLSDPGPLDGYTLTAPLSEVLP
ncbi:SMP-30/gluconolactonase/LRE family protein [Arthrobacter sp. BL-252-APC-1A]|uniref:SMP-30/gluconolactonase/LRE family protein n=1 Tax=Arthrobacter sp. BL-252-APC-1A TaxID=2606622 RepID=UPI0012B1F4E9|nr:SMP-30/gluconolactonase/LRE family protein [Arthrobacter sp. BL-252-APC-1A]MSR99930.1 SMP-30/gluconolactonase/LRE family protein [Arthrobacter sp. BL-252-APC-1A]